MFDDFQQEICTSIVARYERVYQSRVRRLSSLIDGMLYSSARVKDKRNDENGYKRLASKQYAIIEVLLTNHQIVKRDGDERRLK